MAEDPFGHEGAEGQHLFRLPEDDRGGGAAGERQFQQNAAAAAGAPGRWHQQHAPGDALAGGRVVGVDDAGRPRIDTAPKAEAVVQAENLAAGPLASQQHWRPGIQGETLRRG